MNKKILIMPNNENYKYNEKLIYFDELINDLYQNDRYLLPVFLLRCQLVEYSLKLLLTNYPYKKSNFISNTKIEELTMGQTLGKLREINDDHLNEIVEKTSELVDIRNKLTHNLIKSDISIDKINLDIKEKMKLANNIEESIWYFFNYLNEL